MRSLPLLCAYGWLCTANMSGQSADVRPALLGNGRTSLINVINAQRLMQRGQKDAVVSFTMGVTVWGYPGGMLTYEGSPDSKILSQELLDQFDRARFIPARYDGHPAGALINGTLFFAIRNGTPHLRIFLNQDKEHLSKGDDFLAPQMLLPLNKDTYWFDFHRYYRYEGGMVAAKVDIDATGKLKGSQVLRTHPPGAPFGMDVAQHIGEIVFTPAYLNGRAVASSTVWMIPFGYAYGAKEWVH